MKTDPVVDAALRATLDELPEPVITLLLNFQPSSLSAAEWSPIRPFIIALFAALGTKTGPMAHRQLYALTHFVAWCHRQGIPLKVDMVFQAERLETWVHSALNQTQGATALSAAVVGEMASRLRRIGRILNPDSPWPVHRAAGPDKRLRAPYSDSELLRIWESVEQLRSEKEKARIQIALALGLGCGPTASEIIAIRGTDITCEDDGTVTVHIPGVQSRTVPVGEPYATILAKAARTCGEERLIPVSTSKNALMWYFANAGLSKSLPRLNAARLRVTWMVHALRRGVDARTLLIEYAGLQTMNQLVALVEFLPEANPDVQRALMTADDFYGG